MSYPVYTSYIILGRNAKIRVLMHWSKIIYAILKEGIMGNFHVELYGIWTSGSGGYVD